MDTWLAGLLLGGEEVSVVPTGSPAGRNYFQDDNQAQLDTQTAGLFPRVQMDVASAGFLNVLPPDPWVGP